MRKIWMGLLLACLLCASARAEELSIAAAWFQAQYEAVTPFGVAADREESAYALTLADGSQALSLRLTVAGDIRFGRYDQVVRTALIAAESGEELGLEQVFGDLDALQDFLDAYVEENVLDELNTYLDAGELLPVPLDAVSFDACGATFHYPSQQFRYFSGHAGAVNLRWYELAAYLAIDPPAPPIVWPLGGNIDDMLAAYGSLTDPDLVAGGELYEFEAPALRGVQAIADASGRVTALRCARFNINGVRPGLDQAAVRALLGAEDTALALDADTAAAYRLRAGSALRYAEADGQLTLYFDGDGALYAAQMEE